MLQDSRISNALLMWSMALVGFILLGQASIPGKGCTLIGYFKPATGVMHASPFTPLIFMPSAAATG